MSFSERPIAIALEVLAPLTECALITEMSIAANPKTPFNQASYSSCWNWPMGSFTSPAYSLWEYLQWEKVSSLLDFVMYPISIFCVSFSLRADIDAITMVSFSDNSFAHRECDEWHDFKYFKTCSISQINLYYGTKDHSFAVLFIRFLTKGVFQW